MTDKKLPPRAASILHDLEDPSSRDAALCDALRALLLPPRTPNSTKPAIQKPNTAKCAAVGAKAPKASRTKAKQQAVCISEGRSSMPEEALDESKQLATATEVVNSMLKALSEQVKKRKSGKKASPEKSDARSERPLQSISINVAGRSPHKPSKACQHRSTTSAQECQVLAECGRIGLASLRSLQAQEKFRSKFAPMQLETAMSVMIGKFIALDLDDPAVKELCILKRRIETGGSSTQSSKENVPGGERGALKTKSMGEGRSLLDLLRFDVDALPLERLQTIMGFQIQVLKVFRIRKSTAATQGAMAHLGPDIRHSPISLLELCLAAECPKQKKEALSSCESLKQILRGFCSSESLKDPSSSNLGTHSIFQLRLWDLQLMLMCWTTSSHTPNWASDFDEPLYRHVSAYRSNASPANEGQYNAIMSSYAKLRACLDQHFTAPAHSLGILESLLAALAGQNGRHTEALTWIDCALKSAGSMRNDPVDVAFLLCQKLHLVLLSPASRSSDSNLLSSVISALQDVDGNLKGNSILLDDLFRILKEIWQSFCGVLKDTTAGSDKGLVFIVGLPLETFFGFLDSCVALMTRLVKICDSTRAETSCKYQQDEKRKPVLSCMVSTLKAAIMATKLCLQEGEETFEQIHNVLNGCAQSLGILKGKTTSRVKEGPLDDKLASVSLSLSQVYWMRYQSLSSSDANIDVKKLAVQRSIDCLTRFPIGHQMSGRILAKLEKLVSLSEVELDYKGARHVLEVALQICTEGDLLSSVTKLWLDDPLDLNSKLVIDSQCMLRFIRSYPRTSMEANILNENGMQVFFDSPRLSHNERCFCISQQLDAFPPSALQQKSTYLFMTDVNRFSNSLAKTFSEEQLSYQQLLIINRVLLLSIYYPGYLQKGLLDSWYGLCLDNSAPLDLEGRSCFRPLIVQLLASCKTLAFVSGRLSDIEDVLSDWTQVIRQSSASGGASGPNRGDSHCVPILELLLNHLARTGDERQRAMLLNILVIVCRSNAQADPFRLLEHMMELSLQYVRLGYSGKSSETLREIAILLDFQKSPPDMAIKWYLLNAEHTLHIDNVQSSREFLEQARILASNPQSKSVKRAASSSTRLATADAFLLEAKVVEKEGDLSSSLFLGRVAMQILHKAFNANRAKTDIQSDSMATEDQSEDLAASMANLALSHGMNKSKADKLQASPAISHDISHHLWPIFPRLYESLMHLYHLHVKVGLSLEARFYLEEIEKLAETAGSPAFAAKQLALRGRHLVAEGKSSEGMPVIEEAMKSLVKLPASRPVVSEQMILMRSLILSRSAEASEESCRDILSRIGALMRQQELKKLTFEVSPRPVIDNNPPAREKRPGVRAGKRPIARPPTKSTVTTSQRGQPGDMDAFEVEDVAPLALLSREGMLLLARLALLHGNLGKALEHLKQCEISANGTSTNWEYKTITAKANLTELEQKLSEDPSYSLMQESIISCPAIQLSSDEPALALVSQTQTKSSKGVSARKPGSRGNGDRGRPHKACLQVSNRHDSLHVEGLHQAMTDANPSDLRDCVRVAIQTSLLQANTQHYPSEIQPSIGSQVTQEYSRIQVESRLHEAIAADRQFSDMKSVPRWPFAIQSDVSSKFDLDFDAFRAKYIDVIPSSWMVVTLSLSEDHNELLASKLQRDQAPFTLRLPFKRESTTDAFGPTMDFAHAKSEMVEIISLANSSAHNAGDLSRKGAKSEWWQTRASLDARLKDLLMNIETIWFGGMRAIFSSARVEPSLQARFAQSFEQLLDRHLPSRQRSAKRPHDRPLKLHSYVLDLFIALGTRLEDDDLDDLLLDLFYFVVDILQFHGEQNAYDEIDFDAMTADVLDALRICHQASSESEADGKFQHTILILDKELHCFPWESMPCLDGRSVSRLPSLACLRKLVLQIPTNSDHATGSPPPTHEGIHADAHNGAYILNPSGDLHNTQSVLGPPLLNSLNPSSSWTHKTQSPPSESEMQSYLSSHSLFLYFGHGSGGQYIRPRTIRRLTRCATTLLMGCSSGTLTEAGDFEPYGTPVNYMAAGCPALLATLWDVTDKDIDRYSLKVLEQWGLFSRQDEDGAGMQSSPTKKKTTTNRRGHRVAAPATAKGKEKQPKPTTASTISSDEPGRTMGTSLTAAAAQSRDTCILRYLNGAAPVVYGVPVFLSKIATSS